MKKSFPLKKLDLVKTKFGTLAVVGEVNDRGGVSLVFPRDTMQKIAWYEPSELTKVGNAIDLYLENNSRPAQVQVVTVYSPSPEPVLKCPW